MDIAQQQSISLQHAERIANRQNLKSFLSVLDWPSAGWVVAVWGEHHVDQHQVVSIGWLEVTQAYIGLIPSC